MLAMLAAVMLAAAPQHDTIFTAEGGRIIGTVVEESAQTVAIQLPDGTFRRLPRHNVVRIEYADGSVSNRPQAGTQPPPAAAPQGQPSVPPPPPPGQMPPPRAYAPPQPPPAYPPPYYGAPPPRWAPAHTGPIQPFWLSLGIGGMFWAGNVEPHFSANGTFGPQVEFDFEGGLRLNPHLGLGIYADIGAGGPGGDVQTDCNRQGLDCTATSTRVGVLLRHTFLPYSHTTPWVSLGTGYAHGSVDWSGGNFLEYSGWEIARLRAGFDVRSSQVLGFGFYGGVGFTRFTNYRDDRVGSVTLPSPTVHTMFEAGIRLTLFP
jgi:hypothetical protein